MEGHEKKNVDGGYAWAILGGGIVMYLMVVGTVKSYGVLYTEMLSYYNAGSGNTAWIGSLALLMMNGLAPFANWLSIKYTFRKVAITGGLFAGVGFSLSFFVTRMEYLYITYGVLGGLGYGLSFAPCSTIISFYFEKRRSLANGIVVSSSGLGSFLFPFLYQYLIATFGLPGTFLILGAMLFNICAAACFFVQPDLLRKAKQIKRNKVAKTNNINGEALLEGETDCPTSFKNGNKESTVRTCGSSFKFSLYKNPRFLLYVLSFVFCIIGYGNNLILIPSHVRALGYDKTKVVLSVSIMGGCEVVARIFFGWFADKQYIQRKYIFMISMLISSVFAFITPMFDSFAYMAVYAAIIGIFPGSVWSLIAVLVIDVVGLEDFTAAFGLVFLSLASVIGFSQPIIGWLQDSTGDWNASFYLTGGTLFIAGLLIMLEPLVIRYCMKPEPEVTSCNDVVIDGPIKRAEPPLVRDTSFLLDENNDVSFTSTRISKIYRRVSLEVPPAGPKRSSAPLATSSDM